MKTVLAGAPMNVVSIQPLRDSHQLLAVLAGSAAAGFPSPAADYYEPPISLVTKMPVEAQALYGWAVLEMECKGDKND